MGNGVPLIKPLYSKIYNKTGNFVHIIFTLNENTKMCVDWTCRLWVKTVDFSSCTLAICVMSVGGWL